MRKKVLATVMMLVLVAAMCPANYAVAAEPTRLTGGALDTQASYTGLYEYTVGDPASWGGVNPVKQPGYTLSLEILKKKGKKLSFKIQQFRFYGTIGSYIANSAKKITVKLNSKKKAKFSFRSAGGDKVKGKVKLVSKRKVKLSLRTTKHVRWGDRIPITTGESGKRSNGRKSNTACLKADG